MTNDVDGADKDLRAGVSEPLMIPLLRKWRTRRTGDEKVYGRKLFERDLQQVAVRFAIPVVRRRGAQNTPEVAAKFLGMRSEINGAHVLELRAETAQSEDGRLEATTRSTKAQRLLCLVQACELVQKARLRLPNYCEQIAWYR